MAPDELLRALADGAPHSGEELARQFGVTRAAVWKRIGKLEEWGLEVVATPGRGYRLVTPLQILDLNDLENRLGDSVGFDLDRIELFSEISSTNRHLVENPPSKACVLAVCLAEFQTAGRGRRGRVWTVPFGAGLCLSVGWRFTDTPIQLAALTLAAGVAARRVIARVTGVAVELKWPNDLVHDRRKLGGILVELSAESHGHCQVVIGLGLNLKMPRKMLATLCDWPHGAIDLSEVQPGTVVDRQELAAALIQEFGALLAEYPLTGFSPYMDEWREADHLRGRTVDVSDANGTMSGKALGINEDAALLVEQANGQVLRIISGDVSVRAIQ